MGQPHDTPRAKTGARQSRSSSTQQDVIDVILGISKKAEPSDHRVRSFGGELPEDERERTLEERLKRMLLKPRRGNPENDKREMDKLLKLPPKEFIRSSLVPLTENQEKVVRLRFEHQWPIARIARAMGKHRKTIDETMHRAEAKIDSHMGSKADPRSKRASEAAMYSAKADAIEDGFIQKIDAEKRKDGGSKLK
jgi:DNA-directed RNA polymerase specialized sigma24 family protein